jgi:hypothetical protein
MDEIRIGSIKTEAFNPFKASAEELLAYALDDADLLNSTTTINGQLSRALLSSFYEKRRNYRELTNLGFLLVNQGILTEEQMHRALKLQRSKEGIKFGEALVLLGICSLEEIEKNLAAQIKVRQDIKDLEATKKEVNAIRDRVRKYF